MKRFMLSTALVALTMTPALAQTAGDTTTGTAVTTGATAGSVGAGGQTFYQSMGMNEIFASDFIGATVYVAGSEVQGTRMGRGAMGTGGMGMTTDPMAGTGTTAGMTDATTGTTGMAGDTTVAGDTGATTGVAGDTTVAGDTGATTATGDTTVAGDTGATTGMTGDTTVAGDTTGGTMTGGTNMAGVQGVQQDWENIGSINDVVMTREGEIQAVLVDVGGFLGIGARTVAVDIDALNIVDDGETGDFHVVFTSTREEIENAPEFDRDAANQQGMQTAAGTGTATGTGMGAAGTAAGQNQDMTAQNQGVVTPNEGYGMADRSSISVDNLTNANLYDANNENVANVSDVVVGTDGQIEAVVADVGGFLGIGTRTVALDFDQLEIHRDEGGTGNDIRLYVPMTREQLEALPEYEAQN